MHEPLSEDDLALIHALQIWPRASWSSLAPVLGASPPALASRWTRLRENQVAWVYAYPLGGVAPRHRQLAIVELDCAPGRLDDVVATLEGLVHVRAIEYAARGRDLMTIVAAPNFEKLSSLILDELSRTPGVVSTRTHLGTEMHIEGRQWRLDALDTGQLAAIEKAARAATPVQREMPLDITSPAYAPLVSQLTRDGRATAIDIAEQVGRPASTVRRQLGRLLKAGALAMRCELSQLHTRWPVSVTWWCRVPKPLLLSVVGRMRAEPRVRMCMSMTGPANFVVFAWTAGLTDLMQVQGVIEDLLPPGAIIDSSVTLRTRKRAGWLLRPDGRLDTDSPQPAQ
ncbi:Lrp/AsnC family transcriptional regulator [Amycolatopsis rhabdoformis]|uniref:Lrp/AsnC family transcriptional regulator n=1 Tax=Amycolatopsis rhabdoformis TaxID=1448059 RepID=A0ABZ1I8D4_9PSEU|nr:Lrp/AsnC family transcriptional regulator [Amycolatopsis rhabdoformis]WSE29951.1 Lrp/AsnC family transcriptional regulator [Amycolatopsis rhabdoformis]